MTPRLSPAYDWSDCHGISGRPVDSGPGWRRCSQTRPWNGRTSARTTWGSSRFPVRGWPMSSVGPSAVAGGWAGPSGRWWPTGAASWAGEPTPPILSLPRGLRMTSSRSTSRVGARRCWQGASSTPVSSPTQIGSSASRTLTSSVGSEKVDSRCWSTRCRPRQVAEQQTSAGRTGALEAHRPTDEREAWRSYYHARNSILLARRHGRPSWHMWHVAYSARHLQKASGSQERKAILHGLWDGIRGRFGENPDYGRTVGEYVQVDEGPGSPNG